MSHVNFNLGAIRRGTAAWIAILFLWMSTIGVVSHHHLVVKSGASGHAAAGSAEAFLNLDVDCGACDWNQAVQSAAVSHYRPTITTESLAAAQRIASTQSFTRSPFFASLRAPPTAVLS